MQSGFVPRYSTINQLTYLCHSFCGAQFDLYTVKKPHFISMTHGDYKFFRTTAAVLTNIFSSDCQCGRFEDNYHFFFTCPAYNRMRTSLLNFVAQYCEPTLEIFVFGSNFLDTNYITAIFVSLLSICL